MRRAHTDTDTDTHTHMNPWGFNTPPHTEEGRKDEGRREG